MLCFGSANVNFVRTAVVPALEMLRDERMAVLGKLHCRDAMSRQ